VRDDDDDDDDDDTTTTLYAGTPIKNKTPLPGGHNGAPHTHRRRRAFFFVAGQPLNTL
jgi:hypothetical protein